MGREKKAYNRAEIARRSAAISKVADKIKGFSDGLETEQFSGELLMSIDEGLSAAIGTLLGWLSKCKGELIKFQDFGAIAYKKDAMKHKRPGRKRTPAKAGKTRRKREIPETTTNT